ncbi:MAG: hypothetical protein C0403_09395 [Desulfobacterium sp.]|nr:hypothetical protein [Desulfobacterium sp.]
MRPIEINLATHEYLDKRLITTLIIAAVVLTVSLSGRTLYQYFSYQTQIREYDLKIARMQKMISQKTRHQLEKRKKPAQEDIRRLTKQIAEMNVFIARDAFPWNRFLDQLERKIPEGLYIESFSLSDNYDKLIMKGRADAAHKITFFFRRLEEWDLIKTTIIQDLGLKPVLAVESADPLKNGIGFTLESTISIEKLFTGSEPVMLGQILKGLSKH